MEITKSISPEWAKLFNMRTPSYTMLAAVLEATSPAAAAIDRIDHPTQCLIRLDYSVAFASSGATEAFLHEAVEALRPSGGVALIDDGSLPVAITAAADRPIERLAFDSFRTDEARLTDLRNALPPGMDVRAIDRELFARCQWRLPVLAHCGTEEMFFSRCFGLCLAQDDEIVCEAYALVSAGTAELGVVTAEAHRGRGLASTACAHLIEACQERGLRLYWTCDVVNQPSASVARRLGFADEHPYMCWGFRPPEAPG
jgi:GNAT superfamily N-acetyltransferase